MLSVCLLTLLSVCAAFAQYTSGIEGTAIDQSGAAVTGAKVIVTNEATQVARETTTNSSGYFRISEIAPGAYQVEVRMTGFQNWAEQSIQVGANQMRAVYPSLRVGEQKAEVQVSASVETI